MLSRKTGDLLTDSPNFFIYFFMCEFVLSSAFSDRKEDRCSRMQENVHNNDHHLPKKRLERNKPRCNNSLRLPRAYKMPSPMFKHFLDRIFTITNEESITVILILQRRKLSLGLFDLSKASVYEIWNLRPGLMDLISWVSPRSLDMIFFFDK